MIETSKVMRAAQRGCVNEHSRLPLNNARSRKNMLLCASALMTLAATPAFAQVTIDNNDIEIVDPVAGLGGGATQASPWNIAGDLRIGDIGAGTLEIRNGGVVTASNAYVGDAIAAVGFFPRQGQVFMEQGSSLTVTNDLVLGLRDSAGLISMESVSTLSSRDTRVGGSLDGIGQMALSGAGTAWNNSGDLIIAERGRGIVEVTQGASVTSNGVTLGSLAQTTSGRRGTLSLRQGAQWTNSSGNIVVGDEGRGEVFLTGGSVLTNAGDTTLGLARASGSEVLIDDSEWSNANGAFWVGNSGWGELTVTGANGLLTTDRLIIGDQNTANGAVTVENGGTIIVTRATPGTAIMVGDFGDGQLTINSGGTVITERNVLIGGRRGSNSAVIVDGGQLDALDVSTLASIQIGGGGAANSTDTGRLDVLNGGVVNVDRLFVGASGTDGDGIATVRGAGSVINVTSQLNVGSFSATYQGEMTIENGGQVLNDQSTQIDGVSISGERSRISVDGAGSLLRSNNRFVVGNFAEGELVIANGGRVEAGNGIFIGNDVTGGGVNGQGFVTVDGVGAVLASGDGIFVGELGDGVLTLSNGGRAEAITAAPSLLSIASATDSSGVVNIGAAAGDTAVGAGILATDTIEMGDGDAQIVLNHTDTDYVLNADVTSFNFSGTGVHRIDVYSGVTSMNGTWDIDGTTTVHGGRLNINGDIVGDLDVLGGSIGGSGAIDSLTLTAGSTLAPGNSIGTMTINNDLTFNDGSFLEIEVNDAGASDLVDVGGAVTIGANVGLEVLPENGTDTGATYDERTEYVFIEADGGITGEFATVTENFAFLDAEVTIENGEATLTLTRATNPDNGGGDGGNPDIIEFEDVAVSGNQRSIARSLEALGSGSELYDVVVGLSEAQARNAFDQLSGEVHASALASVMQDSRIIHDVAVDRLRNASDEDGLSIWASAYGSWGTWGESGDNTAAELDRSTAGFVFGADFPLFDSLRLGAMLGVAGGDIDIEERGSEADIGTVHFGAYADWDVFKAMTLRAGLLNSWNDLETERAVDISGFNSFSDRLMAEYNANVFQLFAEAGYAFDLGKLTIEPYAGLAYASLSADDVTENGGSARLAAAEYDMDTTFSTLGMRADYAVNLFGANAVLEGGIAWRHAFDDTLPQQSFSFAGTGQAFTTEGVPLAEDAAVVDLGLSLPLANRIDAGLGYNGQLGDGVNDHGIRANISFSF